MQGLARLVAPRRLVAPLLVVLAGAGCGEQPAHVAGGEASTGATPATPAADAADSPAPPAAASTTETPAPPKGPLSLVVVTFNTGTNDGLDHDAPPDDGYTSEAAKTSDQHYGNGMAWQAAIDDVKAFFAKVKPDVVAFQEVFHPGDCPAVPAGKRAGFVCETWKPGDPTVVQTVMGAGYQVACHMGKPDKCLAVKTSFGQLRGCTSALCLDGLAGTKISGCGGGSRIGRGVVDLVGGGAITVVNVHGSSGFKSEDIDCRKKQVEQVFVDLDGAPAANGQRNIILGDLNTDPARLASLDASARRWEDFVGGKKPFDFITDSGSKAEPTYEASVFGGLIGTGFNIDHVISDAFEGSCWHAGVTNGHGPVTTMRYFDHVPAVCTLVEKH